MNNLITLLFLAIGVLVNTPSLAQAYQQYGKKLPSDRPPNTTAKTSPNSLLFAKPNHSWTGSITPSADDSTPQDLWHVLRDDLPEAYWGGVKMDELILQLDLGSELSDEMIGFLENLGMGLKAKSLHPELQNFYVFAGETQTKERVIALAQELKKVPFVQFIEPTPLLSTNACPTNDPYVYIDGSTAYEYQWGLWTTQVDEVWCYYQGGSSNWTAIIDSGTDWFHEDLYNTAWYGYDYADNDYNPAPPDNLWGLGPADNLHGTHVAGIVGAEVNNGIGIAGVSSDTLYIAKVKSDASSGSSISLVAVLNSLNDIATIPQIRVVNLSLGGPSSSASYLSAINNCWNAGKVIVAAAGNDASFDAVYPADYANAIKVSSLGLDADFNYALASYSNYGNIDICAPGGSGPGQGPWSDFGMIWSTFPGNIWGDDYGYMSGTSMAAPLVAGIATTLFAANPFLTNQQARNLIENNPLPTDFGSSLYFGNGVVCAWCAFEEACFAFSNPIEVVDVTLCPGESTVASGTYHPDISYQWFKNNVPIPGATQSARSISSPGSYFLESTSVGNCVTTSNTINISYTPSPFAQFNYSVNGSYATFSNQSNNALSYYWSFGDGSSSTALNPGHFYPNPGVYQVSLTATNECGTSSTATNTIVISPPSGVHDHEMLSQISFGPNPSTGLLTINIPYSDVVVSIVDVSGRVVAKYSSSNLQEIEHAGLRKGQYLLRFESPSGAERIEKITVL